MRIVSLLLNREIERKLKFCFTSMECVILFDPLSNVCRIMVTEFCRISIKLSVDILHMGRFYLISRYTIKRIAILTHIIEIFSNRSKWFQRFLGMRDDLDAVLCAFNLFCSYFPSIFGFAVFSDQMFLINNFSIISNLPSLSFVNSGISHARPHTYIMRRINILREPP